MVFNFCKVKKIFGFAKNSSVFRKTIWNLQETAGTCFELKLSAISIISFFFSS